MWPKMRNHCQNKGISAVILSDDSVYTKYELENWDTLRSWLFIEKSIRDGRERHMCDKW